MEIKGQIIEIIYQNEVNSYTVAEFQLENDITTVVGYLPFINKGDSLKLIGKYITHQDYGEQFKIDTFEKIMPQTIEALENYLAGGIIKGIGPATAKKIVKKFGEETISILKFEPEKLATIKGITESKAVEISEEFNEKWELWQIVGFLEKFGISASNSKKVYEKLGKDAVTEIEKNPYVLLEITYGVDFKKIDKMAMELGLAVDSMQRIESGIIYALCLAMNNGNTCVAEENLKSFVIDLLGVSSEATEEAIINLNVRNKIAIEKRNKKENWIYLGEMNTCEKNIAMGLLTIDASKNTKKIAKIDELINKMEKASKMELSEKQREAIKAVNENNVCIITGGPGTGKTTIIKFIIDIYKGKGKKVILCAPTGRAAKRMTEATGEEACTIHRLLEIGKIAEDSAIEDVERSIAPIDADVIIIDEVSMVDTALMNYILKGIYLGTKLILVGDTNQLPSVGPGNVLGDIIESESLTVIELNQIFRQAAKSKIITNAHRVNSGENFIEKNEIDDEKIEDFFFINENSQEKMLYDVVSLCKERLKKYGNYDYLKDIQVLTPTKKGKLGTRELNKILQESLNCNVKKEKAYGERNFRIGDKIMQTKNNYDIYWEKENNGKIEPGSGIFNGEFGIIKDIDDVSKQIEVKFDDEKTAWYSYSELEELEHSYAITVHKSQRKRI